MILRPMKPILLAVLFSTVVLTTGCKKGSETVAPAPGATPPAVGQQQPAAPKTETPAVKAPAPAAAATPAIADLPKVLAGIKDAATAEAAKAPLDAIVQQLQTAKAAAPAAAAPAAGTEALGGLSKMATDAAAKLGVSADTVAQITTLLANPAIKAVIGPTLEKLQGLLK